MGIFWTLLISLIVSSFGGEDTDKLFSEKDLPQVQEHYMNYPYPFVDPNLEKNLLGALIFGPRIEDINHYLFGGRGDLGRTQVFRILVAGGGTGSSVLHYSYMFIQRNVEVVYLDFSKASMEIAQKRAKRYGLRGITFIQESIYNIPALNLGKFDFIDCYGVLHHLYDPAEGLQILKDSLTPSGGMFLMLYSYYGRQSHYTMQKTLQIAHQGRNLSYQQEVQHGRTIYSNLLPNNWVGLSGSRAEAGKDVGFYDMYLHKQDVAYTIPELLEYIETKGGLHIVDFFNPSYRDILNQKRPFLKGIPKERLHAVNEIIYGMEGKYEILVSRNKNSSATLDDLDNTPFFSVPSVAPIMDALTPARVRSKTISVVMKYRYPGRVSYSVPISKYTEAFIKLVLRRKYCIRDILELICRQFKCKEDSKCKDKITRDFKKTFKALIHHGLVLLRHKTLSDIASRMKQDEIIEVH